MCRARVDGGTVDETDHAVLGRRVGQEVGRSPQARDRGGHDDRARGAGRGEVADGLANAEVGAAEVHAHDRVPLRDGRVGNLERSEEHTSELQYLMRISYAV